VTFSFTNLILKENDDDDGFGCQFLDGSTVYGQSATAIVGLA